MPAMRRTAVARASEAAGSTRPRAGADEGQLEGRSIRVDEASRRTQLQPAVEQFKTDPGRPRRDTLFPRLTRWASSALRQWKSTTSLALTKVDPPALIETDPVR
jgi:hypothetical protein